MMLLKILFVVTTIFYTSSEAANILGVFTSPSPSHNIIHLALAKTLIEQGHNFTILSTFPLKDQHPNYRNIYIRDHEKVRKDFSAGMAKFINAGSLWEKTKLQYGNMKKMVNMQYDAMLNPEFQQVLNNTKFDLVLMGYFCNDFQVAIAGQLKVPIVISWMASPFNMINSYVGNPNEPSYVPNVFIGAETDTTLLSRVFNFASNGLFYGLENFLLYVYGKYYNSYVKELNLTDIPSFEEMRRNISLVFCNSHFSEGPIRPNVPGIVEIGGIQIKNKPDPLDQQLQDFLNKSSKHGAILFSMGSNVKIASLDPKIIKTLYNVFSKLKQNVIWKWEDENPNSVPGKAKNILFRKWLPQDDVLAHTNLKLFVTHGGKGSTVESQYHKVPMIGMPVFADQEGNIDKVVSAGYGLKLDFKTMTEDDLKRAINEIFTNPSYSTKLKQYSDLYKDRPITAKESVVFWVEYVLRHHGAKHLQSPLVHMNVIQQYNIDVLLIIFVVLYLVVKLTKVTILFIIRSAKKLISGKRKKD